MFSDFSHFSNITDLSNNDLNLANINFFSNIIEQKFGHRCFDINGIFVEFGKYYSPFDYLPCKICICGRYGHPISHSCIDNPCMPLYCKNKHFYYSIQKCCYDLCDSSLNNNSSNNCQNFSIQLEQIQPPPYFDSLPNNNLSTHNNQINNEPELPPYTENNSNPISPAHTKNHEIQTQSENHEI